MKKLVFVVAILAILSSCQKDEILTDMNVKSAVLKGAHYNLNIIGVQNPKTATMDDNTGHVIFVPLFGKTAIWLMEGEEFQVLDKNGTDANGAKFMLPNPGLDPYIIGEQGDADVISDYSVYVRPLGKPGGFTTITTCADVVETALMEFLSKDEIKVLNEAASFGGVASIEQVGSPITLRTKGKTQWTNVTAQMLTIVLAVEIDTDGDGVLDTVINVRVPLFDNMLENEYWQYDNKGLKLLQVRFYPWGTDVTYADLLL